MEGERVMETELRTLWDNVSVMLALAIAQIGVWYGLNMLISKHIGSKTGEDIRTCIKEKVVGPAIIRAGIHLSTAWMVTSAFARWV